MTIPLPIQALVRAAADKYAIPQARLLAVVQVEANGQPLRADGAPVFLCEKHEFYKRVDKAKRSAAVKAGLATPKWTGDYDDQRGEKARAGLFARMAAVGGVEVAYRSISMGLGQVMGWHYAELGYGSAQAMFVAFEDTAEQVDALCRLLPIIHALKPLLAGDYKAVAKAYNGAGYKRNDYDVHLADAAAHWEAALRSGQLLPPTDGSLGLGSKGAGVVGIQKALVAAGHPVRDDGTFGPETQRVVAGFQVQNDTARKDGIVDQDTADAIVNSPPMPKGARELATRASLLPGNAGYTSRIMTYLHRARQVHWAGAGGATGAVAMVSGWADQGQQARDTWGKINDLGVVQVLAAHPVIATAIGAVALVLIANGFIGGAEDARVEDEKTGATT